MALYDTYGVQFYDSLSRKKTRFVPITPGHVGLYVCGPTVYGEPHLGHARGAITFDVVSRYLRHLGYKVRYVRNITDVGHLEDEATESGEDKIAKKARLEQIEPMEIAHRYTVLYQRSMEKLGCLSPDIEPSATGHIIEQIELIKKIIEAGYGYVVNGSVYFDISSFDAQHHYGVLSGKILEELKSGSRSLASQKEKRSAHDFALWKRAEPSHIMRWPSPWGEGFPGWHLECTAMAHKYLGLPFDIHGGGIDLQFPHHDCEIAQARAGHNVEEARYWMHNNMLTINGQKMAKSLGNFITLDQLFSGEHPLLERAYSPMTLRFFTLQAHYGNPLDFSCEALNAAEKGMQKLNAAIAAAAKIDPVVGSGDAGNEAAKKIVLLCDEVYTALSDDFNTARAIAALFELSGFVNGLLQGNIKAKAVGQSALERLTTIMRTIPMDVLGIVPEQNKSGKQLDKVMQILIRLRTQARKEKQWALSDEIRDSLAAEGIQLKDGKDGQTDWEFC